MISQHKREDNWHFVDDAGTFVLENPHRTSYLYFPLVNEAGMMSAITPLLHGDVKTGQNTFLTPPVSVEDLHNSRSARNFWVFVDGVGPWSAAGNSAPQMAHRFVDDGAEQVTLEAGFLWHKVTRDGPQVGLRAEITNFVPAGGDQVELMKVTLTNVTGRPLAITPTAAIPLYGRSADNLRDHRHVTSLLHRISTHTHGVLVRPTLSFDERGHRPNSVTYGVLGFEADGTPPVGFFPIVEEFIGEGGSLEWPEVVVKSLPARFPAGQAPRPGSGQACEGFEAIGALRFADSVLEPGEARSYVVVMAVMEEGVDAGELAQTYGSEAQFDSWFQRNRVHWQRKLETLAFHTADARFDMWIKWVGVQPILRRLFGNSFLPYHDYGRGGRGWRDLWQDSLVLLMMEPEGVGELLWNYYAGVRIDGSNATIIGARPGEFKADRNNIPRVWMDHGTWPFLTTRLYVDQSGDLGFLLQEQTYFKDPFVNRAQEIDEAWQPEQGTCLRTRAGEAYRGTILEHMLVQHLTSFFNVGQHNNIRLEGADWNDGLDMAAGRGESVALTAFYASNLQQLGQLVLDLEALGIAEVELAVELMVLLDTLTGPVDYDSVAAKQERLADYFAACRHTIAGAKARVSLRDLSQDLAAKTSWLYAHIRTREWIRSREGFAWFNGYYDDDGERVEGDHPTGVRMTLTGQVFTLMGGVATDEQAQEIVRAADRYLFDPAVGGYRLNTDFRDVLLNLGRCFGFAFGHKENGAMFSHMAVMYAYGLYRRGFVWEGHRVLDAIFQHAQDFILSRMYPGIPEYVNTKGRGMYTYLTGSASWYLLTMLTQVFGVRGMRGDLVLAPKLVRAQFDEAGEANVVTLFAGKMLNVVYHNPAHLDHGEYQIGEIRIDADAVPFRRQANSAILPRSEIAALADGRTHRVDVDLAAPG
jgi:cellobiose phosphorylase